MAAAVSIQLIGFDKLNRRLSALRPKIERQVFRKTLRGTLTKIGRKMKAGTPKLSGAGARSVKVKVRVRRGGAWGTVGPRGKPKFYLRLREFGSSRQTAKPFFRQSIGDWSGDAVRDFSASLKNAVEKAEGAGF